MRAVVVQQEAHRIQRVLERKKNSSYQKKKPQEELYLYKQFWGKQINLCQQLTL